MSNDCYMHLPERIKESVTKAYDDLVGETESKRKKPHPDDIYSRAEKAASVAQCAALNENLEQLGTKSIQDMFWLLAEELERIAEEVSELGEG